MREDVDLALGDQADRLGELAVEAERAARSSSLAITGFSGAGKVPPGRLPTCTTVPPRRTAPMADVERRRRLPETSKTTSGAAACRQALGVGGEVDDRGRRRGGVAKASGAAAMSTIVVSARALQPGGEQGQQADRAGADDRDAACPRPRRGRRRAGRPRAARRARRPRRGRASGIGTHWPGVASKSVGEAALHVRRLRGRAHEVDVLAEVRAGPRGSAGSGRTSATG